MFDDEVVRPRRGSAAGRATIARYRLDRPSLDVARSRALTQFYKKLSEIEGARSGRGGGALTNDERELLLAFAQPERPFSLMFQPLVERFRDPG